MFIKHEVVTKFVPPLSKSVAMLKEFYSELVCLYDHPNQAKNARKHETMQNKKRDNTAQEQTDKVKNIKCNLEKPSKNTRIIYTYVHQKFTYIHYLHTLTHAHTHPHTGTQTHPNAHNHTHTNTHTHTWQETPRLLKGYK